MLNRSSQDVAAAFLCCAGAAALHAQTVGGLCALALVGASLSLASHVLLSAAYGGRGSDAAPAGVAAASRAADALAAGVVAAGAFGRPSQLPADASTAVAVAVGVVAALLAVERAVSAVALLRSRRAAGAGAGVNNAPAGASGNAAHSV